MGHKAACSATRALRPNPPEKTALGSPEGSPAPGHQGCNFRDVTLRGGGEGWATGLGHWMQGGAHRFSVVEIVHGTLGGVIEGAGLVHAGASPGEQQ